MALIYVCVGERSQVNSSEQTRARHEEGAIEHWSGKERRVRPSNFGETSSLTEVKNERTYETRAMRRDQFKRLERKLAMIMITVLHVHCYQLSTELRDDQREY